MSETKQITFSKFQLIHHTKEAGAEFVAPTTKTFENIPITFDYEKNANTIYRATLLLNDKLLFLSFDFGTSEPRAEKVIDVETKEEAENPRKPSQAELRNQLFVYYDMSAQLLYLSDMRKKSCVEDILKEMTGEEFIIKNIYKDIEKFIKQINSVTEIGFTSLADIFSMASEQEQRKALETLTGVTAPKRFKITTEYPKAKQLMNFLRTMSKKATNQELKGLVIKGLSDNGFEQVYNSDSFIQKLPLKFQKILIQELNLLWF